MNEKILELNGKKDVQCFSDFALKSEAHAISF